MKATKLCRKHNGENSTKWASHQKIASTSAKVWWYQWQYPRQARPRYTLSIKEPR